MARNYNRLPSGLLGYIDQKSDGRNPSYLSETTQATLELSRWLESDAEFVTGVNPIATLRGTFNTGDPVPVGEIWLCFNMGAYLLVDGGPALAAGDFLSVQLVHLSPQSTRPTPLAPPDRFMCVGATFPPQFLGPVSFRREPVILRPGEFVGARVDYGIAGANGVQRFWNYRRMRLPA